MLVSLASALVVNLFGAIDTMMLRAKTPHFLQMHSGEIDTGRLQNFAQKSGDVEAFQVLEFLNVDGSQIVIGGNSLSGSVQDNGFSTQSKEFDYLMDLVWILFFIHMITLKEELYMDFTNLQKNHKDLLYYLEEESYTSSYIRQVQENIHWILKHEGNNSWNSYIDIYYDRVGNSKSKGYQKNLKIAFAAIQQFDFFGEYPNRKIKNCFMKRGVYHQLVTEFKELIDFYKKEDSLRGLKENTIYRNASGGSSFLYAMQNLGRYQLCDICEKDVLSFFLDEEGKLSKSNGYKKQIAVVFRVGMTWKRDECRMLLAYLPQIRPKRKNIPYLKPEETDAIHEMLNDETNGLSIRNRAIGKLLYFTGIRACDIAEMSLDAIDWEKEEIRLLQQKTDAPLVLPLTIVLGNAIYDYLINERPKSNDPHLFLGEVYPHYPLEAGAVWHISALIYKEAAVRQNHGERRGTHLFRHNVATSFLGNGIARPVISQTLGHVDPVSLDAYLHADLVHLKECSLSIEAFPVSEEVFLV